MADPTICFSHGQESGPWGSKISAMADTARALGWRADSLDYRGMQDPLQRVERLEGFCVAHPRGTLVLAGSSMGGYVATATAARRQVDGLFLLAPALYVEGYEKIMPATPPDCRTTVVHGLDDDVIPWQHSERYARAAVADLLLLRADHRLSGRLAVICLALKLFLTEVRDEAIRGQ